MDQGVTFYITTGDDYDIEYSASAALARILASDTAEVRFILKGYADGRDDCIALLQSLGGHCGPISETSQPA